MSSDIPSGPPSPSSTSPIAARTLRLKSRRIPIELSRKRASASNADSTSNPLLGLATPDSAAAEVARSVEATALAARDATQRVVSQQSSRRSSRRISLRVGSSPSGSPTLTSLNAKLNGTPSPSARSHAFSAAFAEAALAHFEATQQQAKEADVKVEEDIATRHERELAELRSAFKAAEAALIAKQELELAQSQTKRRKLTPTEQQSGEQ